MNKTSLDTPITTTVAALSDQRLLQRVKELTAIERNGRNFGAERRSRAGRRGGAAERQAGRLRDFGAEGADGRRPAPRYGCEAAGSGRPDRGRHGGNFGAEGGYDGGAAEWPAGSAEPDNLRLLCAAHHRYRHRHARLGAARR